MNYSSTSLNCGIGFAKDENKNAMPSNGPYSRPGYNAHSGGVRPSYSVHQYAAADEDKNIKATKAVGMKNISIQALNHNVLIWAGFFTASILVYFMLSGGEFSFLMTYSAMARMFGFGILNLKLFTSQNKETGGGISITTLQLYFIVFVCRLTSIFRHEGYLPYDKSGDWLYHVIEGASLVFTAIALCVSMNPYKQHQFGKNNRPTGYGAMNFAMPILLIAIFIHPNLNADFISDTAWTYAMYLESAALIPQLILFRKQKSGVVELPTAHFVAALGFGRIMEFFFWIYNHHELANSSGSGLPGYLALLAQLIQLALMFDFFWYYYLAVKNSTPMVLPSHNNLGMNMV